MEANLYPKDLREVIQQSEAAGSRIIYADVNRTDTYTPDGTAAWPYKVAEDAIAAGNVLATSAAPVLVHLAPGTYNMAPVSISTYVKVQGSGWGITVLKALNLFDHFITMGAGSVLRDVCVWGPTAATKAGIYHAPNSAAPAVMADVTISRGYYGFLSAPLASLSQALLENFTFAYAGSNIEELIRVEGFSQTFVTTSIASGPTNSISRAWCASGSNATLTLVDCYHRVLGEEGLFTDDGALTRVLSSVFSGGTTAIRLGSNGSPSVRCEGVLIHRTFGGGYTYDLQLESVNGSLFYSGRCSRDKISNPFDGELHTLGMNDFPGEEGAMVLGEFSVGAGEGAVLPIMSYGRDAYLSGLVSGGEVTRNAGRVLDVAAGSGYVNDGVNPSRVTWTGPTTVTVAAGATEYIYVTAAGTVSHSAVQPTYAGNIILAQAVANASDIVALTRDEISVPHSLSRIQEFFEDVMGPLSVDGAVVSASATPLKLHLEDGEFVIGISERDVDGDDPVTFTPVYRKAGGGWTYGTPTDTIDENHYDDGSGTPAAYGMVNKYKKDAIYILVSDDGTEVFLVYGQTAFLDKTAAENGALPVVPDILGHYAMRTSAVISHDSGGAIDEVIDIRPMVGQNAPVGTVTAADHDLLINLDHDGHLQYLTAARGLAAHGTYPGAHVTGGDTHDHTAGAGAQIDHVDLANIGTRTHTQLESDISAKLNAATKGAPGGVAELDVGGTVPDAQLASTIARMTDLTPTNVGLGNVTNDAQIPLAQKAAANGVASLNVTSKVVQDPANATATPTASKIPISDGSGKLDGWVSSGAAAATPSLRALGAGGTEACAGNDTRLNNSRTPTAHASSHTTGADQIGTVAAGGDPGLMSGSDKTKLDGVTGGAAVASVSGTAPIVSSGGTTPAISISAATTLAAGSMSSSDKSKLDGVASGATNTPLSSTAPVNVTRAAADAGSATEAAKQDHKHDIATAAPSSVGASNTEGSSTSLARADHIHDHGSQLGGTLHATAVAGVSAGFLSSSDKTKLDGISAGAAVSAVYATAPISSSGGTTPSITISAATTVAAGSMSSADKIKLDGITAGAAVASVSGTAPIVSSGGTTPAISISAATTGAAGSMSSADKTKLDGVAAGATVNVFGNNYQSAISAGRSTYNTNTTFQTKATLTTPGSLTGTYMIEWMYILDDSATNQNVEARLYNTTDAAIVGGLNVMRPTNSAERRLYSGFAEVTMAGVAKTFELQYRTANAGTTVGIAEARIKFYRVV